MVAAGLSLLLVAAFALKSPARAVAAGCPNEAIREEQGAAALALPECRAYELVTPAEKDSGEPFAVEQGDQEARTEDIPGAEASNEGSRMAWRSEYILPGSQSIGQEYLSERGQRGWTTENVIPPQTIENGLVCADALGMAAYSGDLSQGVLMDGYGQGTSGNAYLNDGLECGHDEPRLVSGEPEGFQNLFLRDNVARSFQLVNVTPPGVNFAPPGNSQIQIFPASFLAGSADLAQIVFEDELPLTANAPEGDDLYVWNEGAVHLVTVLPNGTPVLGTLSGSTPNTSTIEKSNTHVPGNLANHRHAVSVDGNRVYFQANGNLYLRENPYQPQSPLAPGGGCANPSLACTIQIDRSQGAGGGGGGNFEIASADGSRVYFTDDAAAGLTNDTIPGSGLNLYEYDLSTGGLTDLTSGANASVDGVSAAGEDASYLYFVAEGTSFSSGHASGTHSPAPVEGQPNLYLEHDGSARYIATLSAASDSCDWSGNAGCSGQSRPDLGGSTARASQSGEYLGFNSVEPLTGADNTDKFTGEADQEIYLFDAPTETLYCASCDPEGEPPTAPSFIREPGQTAGSSQARYPVRNVSDDGQLFFDTRDSLLPTDTNGNRDVYEYHAGELALMSSGTSELASYFLDATPDGSDVFIATAQRLVPADVDSAYDYYDARSGGGFIELRKTSGDCAGEACRGPGSQPSSLTSSAGTESPAGGSPPRRKHKHRKHAKASHRHKHAGKTGARHKPHGHHGPPDAGKKSDLGPRRIESGAQRIDQRGGK